MATMAMQQCDTLVKLKYTVSNFASHSEIFDKLTDRHPGHIGRGFEGRGITMYCGGSGWGKETDGGDQGGSGTIQGFNATCNYDHGRNYAGINDRPYLAEQVSPMPDLKTQQHVANVPVHRGVTHSCELLDRSGDGVKSSNDVHNYGSGIGIDTFGLPLTIFEKEVN